MSGGNDLIAHSLWEGDVHQVVAVDLADLAPADHVLYPAEAVRLAFTPSHAVTMLVILSWAPLMLIRVPYRPSPALPKSTGLGEGVAKRRVGPGWA